ncbi:hypothetical protein F5148DRAFT_1371660 [Russula earlei]|uniref:Uncharacterized protein n=1 Tax=Russula earlei TaxID=71964 RepID=A0ACC0TT74_9AGAM|nr:hypothetical protein F5148DRAFT_1371660 [Russula earlei]
MAMWSAEQKGAGSKVVPQDAMHTCERERSRAQGSEMTMKGQDTMGSEPLVKVHAYVCGRSEGKPRLWLGPRRLWLSKTPGWAKAVKPGLAPAWPGLGHGFYYDNGSIRSLSTSLALPLNAFIPSVFKSEHGSSPHFNLRHDTIAVRLRIAPSQDHPSSIVLASATRLRTDPYDAFIIVTIVLPEGSLPTRLAPDIIAASPRTRGFAVGGL